MRTLSLEQFSNHFTGVVLELAPAEGFEPITAKAPIKLSFLWSRLRGFSRRAEPDLDSVPRAANRDICRAVSIAARCGRSPGPIGPGSVAGDRARVGGLVIVQASVEALRGWSLRVFRDLLSFQIVGNFVVTCCDCRATFEKRHVGDILSRTASVQPIQTAISQGVISAVIDGVMALSRPFILFFYSATLALIVIFAVLLNLALSFACFRHAPADGGGDLAGAKEQTHLMETVRAATTLKLMGREAEREGAWRNLHAETTNAGISVGKFRSRASSFKALITGLQTVIVIYVAARLVLDGQGFSVGMLFAFMSFRQTFTDRAIGLVNQIIAVPLPAAASRSPRRHCHHAGRDRTSRRRRRRRQGADRG